MNDGLRYTKDTAGDNQKVDRSVHSDKDCETCTPSTETSSHVAPQLHASPSPPADTAPDVMTSVVPASGTNPIWGADAPLSLPEAAAYTGMPLGTFRQKIYSREIESVKVGKHRKVQPSAVRAYLLKHKLSVL